MNVVEKMEPWQNATRSITRHDDENTSVREAMIDEMIAFLNDEREAMYERNRERIAQMRAAAEQHRIEQEALSREGADRSPPQNLGERSETISVDPENLPPVEEIDREIEADLAQPEVDGDPEAPETPARKPRR